MHIKKLMAAALTAATLGAGLLAAPAQAADDQPVVSTDADARQLWNDMALRELGRIETAEANGGDLGLSAITRGFQPQLDALKYGWTDPKTIADLQYIILHYKKVSNQRGHSGFTIVPDADTTTNGDTSKHYGEDAFGDGTANTNDTVYTVEATDHIGPTFLKAVQAGVLDPSELYFVINSIMTQPTETFAGLNNSKCVLYSDSPADAHYCVFNVTSSSAAFLQDCLNAGYSVPGQQDFIDSLKGAVSYAFDQGGADHGWMYGYGGPSAPKHANAYWGEFGLNGTEDFNHLDLDAIDANKLGLTNVNGYLLGDIAMHYHLASPFYPPYTTSDPTSEWYRSPREIMGRIRMQAANPTSTPQNALRDALFYETEFTLPKPASENAQMGLWALQMGQVATKESTQPYLVTSIPKPTVWLNGKQLPFDSDGVTVHVPVNSTVVIQTTVNTNNTVGKNGGAPLPVVNKAVGLRYNGSTSYLDTKRSGHIGNISFTWTSNGTCSYNRNMRVEVNGEFTAPSVYIKNNAC